MAEKCLHFSYFEVCLSFCQKHFRHIIFMFVKCDSRSPASNHVKECNVLGHEILMCVSIHLVISVPNITHIKYLGSV